MIEEKISLKVAIEHSLIIGDASNSEIIYQLKAVPSAEAVAQKPDCREQSMDQENLRQSSQEREPLFVSIEAKSMDYFREPVTAVFMRDVSKEVTNFNLSKTNEKNKAKLKAMRYSTENVAHEMRTPISSIIVIINLLLALGRSSQRE